MINNTQNSKQLPRHWPASVKYLDVSSLASPNLPASLSSQFCSPSPISHPSNPIHPTRFNPFFEILPITSTTSSIKPSRHPAKGQFGLFATKDIPPRSFILPYLGLVHLEEESNADSEYDLRVWGEGEHGERIPLGIDATECGSEARFCNDYRGILQRANVFFEEWSVDRDSSSGTIKGLALVSGAHVIKKGTELCVSYGKGFWEARRQESQNQDRDEESHDVDQSSIPSRQVISTKTISEVDSPPKDPLAKPQLTEIQARLERQRARLAMAGARTRK